MHRPGKIGFGVVALALALSGAAEAQLLEQTTRGAKRICTYRAPRVGSQAMVQRVEIGLGEPCPSSRPRPDTRPQAIPAMATLATDRLEGSRRICTYSDSGGGEYRHEISAASRCPLTPHF